MCLRAWRREELRLNRNRHKAIGQTRSTFSRECSSKTDDRMVRRLAGKPMPAAAAVAVERGGAVGGDGGGNGRTVEALPLVDHEGRAMPGAFGRSSATHGVKADASGRGRTEKTQNFDAGERKRYFRDDDRMDLDVRSLFQSPTALRTACQCPGLTVGCSERGMYDLSTRLCALSVAPC
jgi:hypothetical protein